MWKHLDWVVYSVPFSKTEAFENCCPYASSLHRFFMKWSQSHWLTYWIIRTETAIFSRNSVFTECIHAMHHCDAQDTGVLLCVRRPPAGASHNPVFSNSKQNYLMPLQFFKIYMHCYNVYWIYFDSQWFCLLSETVNYFCF